MWLEDKSLVFPRQSQDFRVSVQSLYDRAQNGLSSKPVLSGHLHFFVLLEWRQLAGFIYEKPKDVQ